jgi:hypothetical protein
MENFDGGIKKPTNLFDRNLLGAIIKYIKKEGYVSR